MVNQELRLLALMLQSGDFSPLQEGSVEMSDFGLDGAKHVVEFIQNYHDVSKGAARYPSLAIVRDRFGAAVELPDPDPADRLPALVYEVRVNKLRSQLKLYADTFEVLADTVDPLEDLPVLLKDLRRDVERVQPDDGLELSSGIEDLLDRYESGDLLRQGIPWMWPSVERELKGRRGGEFHVFVGRPKQRKTFVATANFLDPFMVHGGRLMFFTTEMPKEQILMRSVAKLADLRYREMKNSALDEAELLRFYQLAENFGRWTQVADDAYEMKLCNDLGLETAPALRIVKATGRTVGWCMLQAENWGATEMLVDSFYRLAPENMKKSDADWKAVTSVSRALKDGAMELEIPVTGTHQLNRGAEGKIANTSNVSLADAIGQDVDSLWQVITGKAKDGTQISALWNMANREATVPGVLIHNEPCNNFREIAPLESIEQAYDLLETIEGDTERRSKKKGGREDIDEKKLKEQREKLNKKYSKDAVRKQVEQE